MKTRTQDSMWFAVIEKYTRNTRFCLICNYVSKIIPALQSRCTRFRFPPLEESYVKSRLAEICKEEEYAFPYTLLPPFFLLICHNFGNLNWMLNVNVQIVCPFHGQFRSTLTTKEFVKVWHAPTWQSLNSELPQSIASACIPRRLIFLPHCHPQVVGFSFSTGQALVGF